MRLVSYNIHKGIGGRDRRYRLARIIDILEAQNPDLFCLQEVARGSRRSRYDDQPRVLAKYFGAAASFFQATVHYKYGGYGNLFASRWPVRISHQVSLSIADKKPRGAQLAVVETPEGLLHLTNWHLGLGEKERQWQVAHLLSHRLFRESEQLPTLIAGDTNDWRNSLANSVFSQHGFRHATHPVSRFRSFPAWLPVGAIDKAFFRGNIFIRKTRLIRSALAHRASDHLPLLIDFHLSGGSDELFRS